MEVRWLGGDRPKPAPSRQALGAQCIAGLGTGLKHKGRECRIEGERGKIKVW